MISLESTTVNLYETRQIGLTPAMFGLDDGLLFLGYFLFVNSYDLILFRVEGTAGIA